MRTPRAVEQVPQREQSPSLGAFYDLSGGFLGESPVQSGLLS